MTRHSIEPRDRIFLKGYGLLPFAKNMVKNLSCKYGQELFDHAKEALKSTSKRLIKKSRSN